MSEFSFFTIMDFEYAYNHSSANAIHLPSMTPSFQPTHHTNIDEMSYELNIPYTIFEILVAICAIVGNLMVIIVFQRERKLRRRTNYYIVSLAMADFLVGSLGVPFAILASIGLPTNLYACLFTVSLLVVLCTISIFCLVAVSVDRYWAILYPMAYSRNVRTRTAIVIISMCWFAGTVVGFLPLFGWHAVQDEQNHACLFVEVMDYNYLVFLYVATIITPALLMLAFYAHIYKVIIKQVRQIVTMNPKSVNNRGSSTIPDQKQKQPSRSCHGGTMLRVLGAARKRDVKATQNLSIIVLFFMICWIPLYTINCIKAFCPNCDVHPKLTLFCIILSHLNSAVNPVLYAYHLKDFRLALKNLILKILGIEVEQPMDTIHRYSLASQHRLQSLDVSGRNTQTRIYIDSPVWLRQQQEQALKNSQLVKRMTPCLNNIPQQTVAVAVASVTSDIEKQMWNIMEVSSNAEINDTDLPSTPKGHRVNASISAGCNSHYSYENHNFSSSADDSEFEEVFLPQSHDAKQFTQAIHSHSDYEIINKNNRQNSCTKIQYVTPPLTPKQIQQVHENRANPIQNSFASSSSSSSNGYSSIFIIDSDCKPISPGHKPKFKASSKSFNKSINLNSKKSLRHSCSWTSDNSCTASKDALQIAVPNYKSTDVSPPPPPPLSSHSNSSRSSLSAVLGFSSNPSPSLSTELSLICNSHHVNQTNNNNNSNSNSNSKNNNNNGSTNNSSNHNLNYYTFHYPQSSTKFSPFKAINNLLLPPIVRHSSLFQLFHNSNGHLNETSSSNSNNSTSTTIAAQSMTDSSNKSQSETNHIIDSISAINADLIESSTAMQIHSIDSQIVK